jgi:aminoglycoside phosphotransferase (APT) family kinase protein
LTLDDQGNDGARIATIVSVFPELRDAQFKSTSGGWDSVALTANDRLIFKFPRHAAARSALVREAALLGVIRPQLTLPVPDMKLHGDPVLFSSHVKIAGEQLLAEQYEMLPEAVRVQLAKTLGQFYAELHALDPMKMVRAGATSIAPWLQVADLRANALPLLPLDARAACEGILSLYAQLAPDPQGLIFGMFDCHGWNMAFDHAAQRLNGVYDFSDSGVGPLHQDFIYPAFVAPELPFRMADYYEQVSGRKIDRARIATLIGAHRLVELAAQADNPPAAELMRANVLNWLRWTAGV